MYYVYTPDYKTFDLYDATTHSKGPTFNDARLMNGILNGDLVTYDDMSERPFTVIRRARHPHLAGLLELTSKTLYGMTSRHVPIYLFHPFDRRYPPFRVGCSEKDRTVNKIVTISVDSFEAGQTFPRGHLMEVLGDAGDLAVERLALQHSASPFYKKKFPILSDCLRTDDIDCRPTYDQGWDIFNIDPEGCKDIDDVIGLRCEGPSLYRCIIGIADVDSHIPAGSQLDEYASYTLQTIYDDGMAVRPMLPPLYSEGLCSLKSGQLHNMLAYEFLYDIHAAGADRIRDGHFIAILAKNHASYTYESILGADDRLPLHVLRQLTYELGGKATDPHDWVATLMKYYNIQAAKQLVTKSAGILRTHTGPKLERIAQIEKILGPEVAQQLGNEAASYALAGCGGTHHGIGTVYCHATSPIRRYADLINQRILKGTLSSALTHELIYNLNVRSKAARQYDRISFFLEQLEASPNVDLIIVNERRAYVPAWKMLVKFQSDMAPGTKINARLYYDASQPSWKNKIVFQPI